MIHEHICYNIGTNKDHLYTSGYIFNYYLTDMPQNI